MFSKKKNTSKLDAEQRELYEYARRRAIQKKRLFQHFVVFLVGAIILIVLNVVIGFEEDYMPLGYNWFVWAILIWSFFFLIHVVNVFVTNTFMGKEWEQKQLEKLVRKQKDKIAEMQKDVERDYPVPSSKNHAAQQPDNNTINTDYSRQPSNPKN